MHSFWLLSLVTITTMLLYFLVFRSSFISLLNKMPFAYTLYWQSNNSKAINCLWIYEHIFMFIIYSMRSIDTNCQSCCFYRDLYFPLSNVENFVFLSWIWIIKHISFLFWVSSFNLLKLFHFFYKVHSIFVKNYFRFTHIGRPFTYKQQIRNSYKNNDIRNKIASLSVAQ